MAIYIANGAPTKQLGRLTFLEQLYHDLDRPNPRPSIGVMGCKAYTKINPERPPLKAFISYLQATSFHEILVLKVSYLEKQKRSDYYMVLSLRSDPIGE